MRGQVRCPLVRRASPPRQPETWAMFRLKTSLSLRCGVVTEAVVSSERAAAGRKNVAGPRRRLRVFALIGPSHRRAGWKSSCHLSHRGVRASSQRLENALMARSAGPL